MATRDELETAIDAAPENAENYLVLGDLLQQQQDPYGESISLADVTFVDKNRDRCVQTGE